MKRLLLAILIILASVSCVDAGFFAGSTGGTSTSVTVADTTDSTAYCALFESATGNLGPKTDAGCTYNATTGQLTVTSLGLTYLANHINYVDASRTDTYTADGTMLKPYTTILAALTAINADALVHVGAGDYAGTNYAIVVAPGTYSDNLTFANYKHMRIIAPAGGVFITGTITSTQTQQSGDYYSRLEFIGPDGVRTEKGPGLKLAGNFTATRNNDSLTYYTFKGCWITGNMLFDTDGTHVLQFNGSRIAGTIDTGTFSDADSAVLIETTGWTEFAGAITDKVSFYNVDNAEFWGAIAITPIFDCRITNSRFGSTVSIIAVKNLYVDTVSLKAIIDRTPTLTGMTIGYLDQVANGTYKGIIDTAAPGAIGATTPAAGTFTTLTATKQLFAAATELTLSSDAVTATQAVHTIDTQADAASDDLATINGGADGQILLIRANHADRTIVVKSATGNILTGGTDITLDDTNKYLLLVYDGALSKWVVVGGSASIPDPLTVAKGGTGAATFTANLLLKGNTTSAIASTGIIEDASANVGIASQSTFGTSAAKVLAIPSGTAPTTSPADAAQIWVADKGGVAAKAALHMRDEAGNTGPIMPGQRPIVSHSATESATADTLYGDVHLVTGAYTVTLPATSVGMNATFCSTTAAVFSIDLTGSDAWTLAGTALSAANKISSSGAAGECVYFVVTASNVVRTIWTVGVWIDGGS